MTKPNAVADIELYPASHGGFAHGLRSFPARLLARSQGNAQYGFVVLQGSATEIAPGTAATVEIAFLDLSGAMQVFGTEQWIPIGEPTKERGRMRIQKFYSDS